MTRDDLILIGGGGHCRSVIDVIESEGKFKIKGILDLPERIGQQVLSYQVIGSDNDLNEHISIVKNFHITIGHIKSSGAREKLFHHLRSLNVFLPPIISSRAYLSRFSSIGDATCILHNVVINSQVVIGENSIINTGAIIEHDVRIGNHSHISTGTVLNGGVNVGNNTFIGSNSTVNEGVKITDNCVIGSGSVVIRDILEPGTYVGSPARKID